MPVEDISTLRFGLGAGIRGRDPGVWKRASSPTHVPHSIVHASPSVARLLETLPPFLLGSILSSAQFSMIREGANRGTWPAADAPVLHTRPYQIRTPPAFASALGVQPPIERVCAVSAPIPSPPRGQKQAEARATTQGGVQMACASPCLPEAPVAPRRRPWRVRHQGRPSGLSTEGVSC
mgnify:CR=1 FL=1